MRIHGVATSRRCHSKHSVITEKRGGVALRLKFGITDMFTCLAIRSSLSPLKEYRLTDSCVISMNSEAAGDGISSSPH